ncbi:NAD(P)-binding protein [Rhizodiscina lignyota]|uniref:NAD(P)-binding protein n=1 Tax=Rhizodiscina lignyota TaxID=1504668 RepID=A0A9P4M9Y1_9PEZI|nr:NAD(P)-binding protein [Rhizodiscina lignyota]
MLANFPPHFGATFTKTLHSKPEGSTDPVTNRLPSNFVVVITGAGKKLDDLPGQGYYTAIAYAKAGAHGISISSRTQSDLDKTKADILKINPKVDVLSQVCDVTKDADVRKLAAEVKSHFGRVDAVVSSAGHTTDYIDKDTENRRFPRGAVEDEGFDHIVAVNLIGSHNIAKHFIPLLAQTKDGVQSFVNITSMASLLPTSQMTPLAFNISKLAANRMVESMQADHGDEGILAFSLHPGSALTPGSRLHSTTKVLSDDPALCGGFCTWLTKERREWLSGRYVSSNWDVDELASMKDDIVEHDKLKMRMVV